MLPVTSVIHHRKDKLMGDQGGSNLRGCLTYLVGLALYLLLAFAGAVWLLHYLLQKKWRPGE